MSQWKTRLTTVITGAVALTALGAIPAAAHVTVNPDEAEQGGYEKLTFRVPTERDDASTTKLEITFPEEHPLSSVSVKPHPGWSYEVSTVELDEPVDQGEGRDPLTETVRTITWTADSKADAIKPGEFDEFDVSAGRLPEDADEMVFKAVQTYDSGEVVRWIEVAAEGAEQPEHPAPILKLTAADDEHGAAAVGTEQEADPAAAETETEQPASATTALVLSIIALVVGAAGLGIGLLARRRS